jgi:hypothetical protein
MIQCTAAGTGVYLEGTNKTAIANRRGIVSYSVDNKAPADRPFILSSDSRSVGLWNSTDAIQFVNALSGGQKLSVAMKQASGAPLKAEFRIGNIEAAIAPVRAACRW